MALQSATWSLLPLCSPSGRGAAGNSPGANQDPAKAYAISLGSYRDWAGGATSAALHSAGNLVRRSLALGRPAAESTGGGRRQQSKARALGAAVALQAQRGTDDSQHRHCTNQHHRDTSTRLHITRLQNGDAEHLLAGDGQPHGEVLLVDMGTYRWCSDGASRGGHVAEAGEAAAQAPVLHLVQVLPGALAPRLALLPWPLPACIGEVRPAMETVCMVGSQGGARAYPWRFVAADASRTTLPLADILAGPALGADGPRVPRRPG